jgi:hypothetical protein
MDDKRESRGIFDPDFCEKRGPICTRARRGSRWAKILQAIEMVITFGGCPWGRARQRKYGVKPNESLPPESTEPR